MLFNMQAVFFVLSFVHTAWGTPVSVGCGDTGRDISYADGIAVVSCPANCQRVGLAFGISIHPLESSICASAISDGVCPPVGGIVVVSMVPAVKAYFGKRTGVIATSPFDSTTEGSFHLYGLSTLDQITSDIRLVDVHGQLAASGLLQLRTDSGFGTVCGANLPVADVVCQALGYDHGTLSSSPCSAYGGSDLCGSVGSPVVKVSCRGGELSLDDCVWSPPDTDCLEHQNDAVISCLRVDTPAEPTDGAVRLLAAHGSPSIDGTGRVDVFQGGQWSPVCSSGFTSSSARVACRQMGYSGVSEKAWDTCRNLFDGRYCGTVPPDVAELKCKGHEGTVLSCPHQHGLDVLCAAEDSVVLMCGGTGGDPRGQPRKVPAPHLTVAAFPPRLHLSCDSSLRSTAMAASMPGSSFVGTCGACGASAAPLQGTSIYTSISSICKASVHAGVFGPEGGDVVVTVAFGQDGYFGGTSNNVQSAGSGRDVRSLVVAAPVSELTSRIARRPARSYAGKSSFGDKPS